MTANIGVSYAITYLFGTFTVIFFASSIAPRLLGINLAQASQEYERELGGGKSQLAAGQIDALRRVVARVHEVGAAGTGRSVVDLEQAMNGVVIGQVMRGSVHVAVEPALKLQT